MKRTECIFVVLCFILLVQKLNGQETFQLQFFHPADDYPITTIEDKFGNFVSAGQQIVQPFMQNGKIWIIKANGSIANSFSGITSQWVQGITTSTGAKPYSNYGLFPINKNSTKRDFMTAYPKKALQLMGLPNNYISKNDPEIIYKK